MGVFTSFAEQKKIYDILMEYDLVGRKVYFDDISFTTDMESKMKDIEWILLPSYHYTYMSTIVSIDGKEYKIDEISPIAITLIYLKLQKYEREYNQD